MAFLRRDAVRANLRLFRPGSRSWYSWVTVAFDPLANISYCISAYRVVEFGEFSLFIGGNVSMARSIHQRISDSFSGADKEDICSYLQWLKDANYEYARSFRRNVIFTLILMGVFEIASESTGSSVSLGPFHVYKGYVVLQVLPILVSYMFFQIVSDTRQVAISQAAFSETLKLWSAKAESNDLDILLRPSFLAFSNPGIGGYSRNETINDRLYFYISAVFDMIFSLAVLAFIGQAYYVLYSPQLSHHILWLIEVILSGSFCLVAIVYFLIYVFGEGNSLTSGFAARL